MGFCASINLCNQCNDDDTLYLDNVIEFEDDTVKISNRI